MAVLSVQEISKVGITPTFAAAAGGGDEFPNDGNCWIEVKNTGGSICTVTVASPAKVQGLDVADVVVAVPATTGDKEIGPFPTDLFNAADGNADVTYSGVTGVTIGVFRVPH